MKLFALSVLPLFTLACGATSNVTQTNRGELKVALPDAGMAQFQASHDFGNVKAGESARLSFNVVNTGVDALDIRVVKVESDDTGAFFVQGGTGSVAPQVTRAFNVTFAPTRMGAYTGKLTFETNARAESAQISLTGTAVP